MKTSRFKQSYRKNSSKLHKKIGDILRSSGSIFSRFKIYQEYPVNKINPSCQSSRYKFDWVILDLYLVIEAHGEQHYRPVMFGSTTQDEAEELFLDQKHRDNIKMDAAISAGFTYVVVPFSDIGIITEDYIWQLYKEHYNSNSINFVDQEKQTDTEYKESVNKLRREYAHQQYKKNKKYLNQIKLRRLKNEKD